MKKVLSLVLVLCMVLGSFSMVFADTTVTNTGLKDIDGNANEAAITVVNDLGIVTGYEDGTFKPVQAVTRAEFAAMITRALDIPESALAGLTTTTFKDTQGYGWAVPYLAFCDTKGIMLGDGNGNAMPGRTITVNEAMTMVCRALGITNNSSWLVGSWPANYVSVAKSFGLYEDVKATATVDRASAAQIIYNALTIPTFSVNADGKTEQTGDELIIQLGCEPDYAEVLNEWDDNSKINLADKIGAFGDKYTKDGDIVAFDIKSTFLEGKFKVDSKTGKVTFKADGISYNVKSDSTAIASTTAIGDINYQYTNEYGYSDDGTVIIIVNADDKGYVSVTIGGIADQTVTLAVDVTGKTISQIYSISAWDDNGLEYGLDEVVAEDIADDLDKDTPKFFGEEFVLDKSNEIDENSFLLVGVDSLDKIADDNVVYIYTDGSVIRKIEVGTETVTGKVTKVAKDSDKVEYYVINGQNYYAADGIDNTPATNEEGTAYLDVNGDIFNWDVTDSKKGNYAVVSYKAYNNGKDRMITLFDKDGNEADYVLKSDTVTTANALTVGSIVTFELDKNGKIKDIAPATTHEAIGKVVGTTVAKHKTASDVIVFVYDEEDKEFSLGKIADLNTDIDIYSIVVYDGTTIEVLLTTDAYTGNSEDTYGLVTRAEDTTVDEDGNDVYLYDIFLDGIEKLDVSSEKGSFDATPVDGKLMTIAIDADGYITDVKPADVSSKAAVTTVSAVDGVNVTVTGGDTYVLASDAIVYVWDEEDEVWTIGKATKNDLKGKKVTFYDTEDADEVYEVVMAVPYNN